MDDTYPYTPAGSSLYHLGPITYIEILECSSGFVITYVKPPSLPLLGHLSAVTNTDFNITCEKRGQGRTYRSQNKLQTLLESGNLLSSIFPQYKEFFPLSSCIIKSWGQSLGPHKSAFLECPWNFTHSS